MPSRTLSPARPAETAPTLGGIEQLSWLMDRAVRIPGTPIRFGLDALLGLVPVGGDLAAGLIQTGIVLAGMHYYKVPRAVAARMAANVLLDVAVGAVPLLGDLFDVAFKANTRNIALLKQVEQERQAKGRASTAGSKLYLAGIAALLLGSIALAGIGAFAVLRWILEARG